MKIYLVVFITENKIDSVVKMTKSKLIAQQAFIHNVSKSLGRGEAALLLTDFANGILDENVTIAINDSMKLQMIEFDA